MIAAVFSLMRAPSLTADSPFAISVAAVIAEVIALMADQSIIPSFALIDSHQSQLLSSFFFGFVGTMV